MRRDGWKPVLVRTASPQVILFHRRQGQKKQHLWGSIAFPRRLGTASENMLRGRGQGQQRSEVMTEVQAGGHEMTEAVGDSQSDERVGNEGEGVRETLTLTGRPSRNSQEA